MDEVVETRYGGSGPSGAVAYRPTDGSAYLCLHLFANEAITIRRA